MAGRPGSDRDWSARSCSELGSFRYVVGVLICLGLLVILNVLIFFFFSFKMTLNLDWIFLISTSRVRSLLQRRLSRLSTNNGLLLHLGLLLFLTRFGLSIMINVFFKVNLNRFTMTLLIRLTLVPSERLCLGLTLNKISNVIISFPTRKLLWA